MAGLAVIRHLRRLVHGAANPVAHELTHHIVAVLLDVPLEESFDIVPLDESLEVPVLDEPELLFSSIAENSERSRRPSELRSAVV